MKKAVLLILIIIRLLTNDGVLIQNRKPPPKRQPVEVFRFIKRPAKRGRKKLTIKNPNNPESQ